MISFEMAIYTRTESNTTREAPFAKVRRAKQQRQAAYLACCCHLRDKTLEAPLQVRLVRIAPGRGLDQHDNLPSSVKHLVDGIADYLEVDDRRHDLVRYVYGQERGPPGEYRVRVEIVPMPDAAQLDTHGTVPAQSGG